MANSNGWGDGAANNSIGWGQGANNAIAWGDSHAKSWAGATDIVGLTTDPAASAYFSATGITGATQQTAIDNLVKGLKQDGLWSKMKAVYPFVTDNRNLLGYTEDFSNAAWLKSNTTVTANSITAPNDTLTADTITHSSTSADIRQIFSGGAGIYTYTIYVKYNNVQWVRPLIGDPTNSVVVWFDIQNGIVGSNLNVGTATLISKSIQNIGSGWYRLNITVNLTSTSGNYFQINTAQADGNSTRQIGSFYLWGAQLELGSTATTYQPIATTQQAFISNQFKYNLVNPVDSDAAFRLVFNGGWTHSANGATPNGTNGYADTKLVPSSVLLQDSTHLSYYSRTNISGNQAEIGAILQGDTRRIQMELRYLGNFASDQYNYSTGRVGVTNADSLGYYIGSRLNSTTHKAFKNNIQLGSTNTGAAGLISAITHSIYIGATNDNTSAQYYSSKQTAFASIGDGLTDTEAANLYTRVQAFQTALSRQV